MDQKPKEPGESTMQVLLRTACERLVAAEPSRCDPESLARETGIDPEVARGLLPSAETVVRTVAESALRRQMDFLTRRISSVPGDDPTEQLLALGKAAVEWAVENRDDFHVLNLPLVGQVVDGEELARYHRSLQELTASMLDRAREQGRLRPDMDPLTMLVIVRAFTYGLSRLYVDRQLRVWLPDEQDLDKAAALTAALDAFAGMLFVGKGGDQPIRSEA